MSDTLITKYRPAKFDEVVGQDAVVRSLRKVAADKSSRAFLLTGPSGTGKTTLARIVAAEFGCRPHDIMEVDAATHSGVEEMRAVAATLQYRPVGDGAVKAIIVDECHAASKNSWQATLKAVEEPPEWAVWLFCTTEPARVPPAVVTRCARYDLKPVQQSVLLDLLDRVLEAEGMNLGEDEGKIVQLCAKEADGSPRQALVNLAVCADAKSAKEARELLRSAEGSREAVDLARALLSGAGWAEVQGILNDLADANPESVRHVVRAYATKAVLGAGKESAAAAGMSVLEAFSEPCNSQDGISPIVLACGMLVLGE